MRVENMLGPRKPRDYKIILCIIMLSVYLFHDMVSFYFHIKIINTIALHKLVVSNMHIQVIVINVQNSLYSRC